MSWVSDHEKETWAFVGIPLRLKLLLVSFRAREFSMFFLKRTERRWGRGNYSWFEVERQDTRSSLLGRVGYGSIPVRGRPQTPYDYRHLTPSHTCPRRRRKRRVIRVRRGLGGRARSLYVESTRLMVRVQKDKETSVTVTIGPCLRHPVRGRQVKSRPKKKRGSWCPSPSFQPIRLKLSRGLSFPSGVSR